MNVCRESGLRLILDTDPGVDDAIAILLALAAPRVDLAGLTTLGGNVPRARATRNALALLQAAGRLDIPVAQGAARPLTGRFRPSVAFHGPGGLSARLPEPASPPLGETAVDFLEAQLDADPGGVTVVALGPLTNLARLERRRPGILARSAGVVIMGGAVETRGNVSPRAEFNFHSDPLAASQVLDLDIPIMLADLGRLPTDGDQPGAVGRAGVGYAAGPAGAANSARLVRSRPGAGAVRVL